VPSAPRSPAAPRPDRRLSVSTVSDPRPGRVVVEVVGDVASSTAPALGICLSSQARRAGLRELVVFLGQVTFLDVAGVEVLAEAGRDCRERGARMIIRTGGRRAGLRPLQASGLTDLVDVDPADDAQAQPGESRRHARREPRRAARGHGMAGTRACVAVTGPRRHRTPRPQAWDPG
jgi:anti-anti-sigma factor